MSGPRILLIVAGLAALLGYLALFGDEGADVARGVEETDIAFAAIQVELTAMQPAYEFLTSQGGQLRFGVKEQRDRVQRDLARLQGDRVGILTDDTLHPRERLPRLRSLVTGSDQLLAYARTIRRQMEARTRFMQDASAVLAEIADLDGRLAARLARADAGEPGMEVGEADRARHATLATTLAETTQLLQKADQLIGQNLDQGTRMADQTLRTLQELRDGLRNIADDLDLD